MPGTEPHTVSNHALLHSRGGVASVGNPAWFERLKCEQRQWSKKTDRVWKKPELCGVYFGV